MATIKRTTPDPDQDVRAAKQWTAELVGVKKTIKDLGTRQATITKRIKAFVQEAGEPDDQGHLWVNFDEPVDGCVALQMQRKVSKPLNEEKATAILEKAGLYAECTTTVTVIDQDAIMAAHYAGKLTEDEVDAMFPPSISFALLTPTSK